MPESIREVLGLGKVPPQNTEAEMAVLGSMLIEKEAALKAFDMLREGDFYSPTHQIVFEAIRTLHDQNVAADIVTVGDYLQHNNKLNESVSRATLIQLTNLVPSALNVEHYARIVREKSVLRSMIDIAKKVSGNCFESGDEAQKLLDEAQQMFFELAGIS